jgi:hypothetical protein
MKRHWQAEFLLCVTTPYSAALEGLSIDVEKLLDASD